MRRKLPQYILDNNIEYDYVFCTGDIRDSSAEHWREPFPSADFLKNLCEIRNISLDNLFIVPGNHDVNRTASDRENVVENMLWRDNKSWSRNYKTELGNIGDSTLQALHDGEKEFRSFLGKIYDRDKLQLYDDYLKPHFVVETEHFNILHIDSTLAYSEKQNRDLIIGSRQLQLALDDLNDSKPTIVLSHYAITSLDPEERRMVSNMLDDYHIYLWLAGHEHYHDLKPCGYIHSIQCGELKIEDRCKSTFLVGEYDTETGQVDIRAYNWFSPEGWAEYPILWRNSKTYTLRLSTKCNDGRSFECVKAEKNNESYKAKMPAKIISGLFANIESDNEIYSNDNPLVELVNTGKNFVLLEDILLYLYNNYNSICKNDINNIFEALIFYTTHDMVPYDCFIDCVSRINSIVLPKLNLEGELQFIGYKEKLNHIITDGLYGKNFILSSYDKNALIILHIETDDYDEALSISNDFLEMLYRKCKLEGKWELIESRKGSWILTFVIPAMLIVMLPKVIKNYYNLISEIQIKHKIKKKIIKKIDNSRLSTNEMDQLVDIIERLQIFEQTEIDIPKQISDIKAIL